MIKIGLFSRKKKERTLERKSIFDCDFEQDLCIKFEEADEFLKISGLKTI